MALAEQLPGRVDSALIGAARGAFTHGLRPAAATSAIVATGLAVFVVVLLRHIRAGSAAAATP